MTIALILFTHPILLQWWSDLYEWLNSDPVGNAVFMMVLYGISMVIVYFVLRPCMLRRMEEMQRVREGDSDEW